MANLVRQDATGAWGAGAPSVVRRRLDVRGRVQGVGFRPFVYRLARELGLGGRVGNDSHGAFIEVEGVPACVEVFTVKLRDQLPPLARISSIEVSVQPPAFEQQFRIEASARGANQDAEISPDVALCADCLREMLDPSDRRYGYPFINCMNCGPRYSIIRAVPYDRSNTTMARFVMCPACQAEYDDPENRRFHAQPNACPVCGPRLWMVGGRSEPVEGDPVVEAARWLSRGRIVAVKGIGGFHLACRADDAEVVERLRARKHRDSKAFAVMVRDLEAARALAEVDAASAEALLSPSRPIVLMPRRPGGAISPAAAPASDYHGLMLPYTPLHHLLFAQGLPPLVMTSANPSEEPLCRDNDEALARLTDIADAFLLNDRDIERRVDDSVVIAATPRVGDPPAPATAGRVSRVLPIRRARGLAPAPVEVPAESPSPVLAVGGELKSTVCLLAGRQAVVSEHLGELSNAAAYRNFVQTIDRFKELLRLEPAVVAFDLHPDYAATRYARGLNLRREPVQHHHAHVVSCMADNAVEGEVIGVSCDGTGYGTDGAIWGCELLVCDEADFRRAGHLRYFPLLGGDTAAQETWRPAAGLLRELHGADWLGEAADLFPRVEPAALRFAEARLAGAARVPLTSSLGRLFDAAAFLIGVCDRNRHEAEAAMILEALARRCDSAAPLPFEIEAGPDPSAPFELDVRPAIEELIRRARAGMARPELARAFHDTLSAMLMAGVLRVARQSGLDRVVLSGGCMANRLLLEGLCASLTDAGLIVYAHERVPTGDGGLALGQAVAAAARLRAETEAGRSPA